MDNESLILYFHPTRAPSFKATCIITTMRATAYSTRFLIQSSNMCTFVGACKLAPYVHALPFLPLASAYLVVDVRPPYGYPRAAGYERPSRQAPGHPFQCPWRPLLMPTLSGGLVPLDRRPRRLYGGRALLDSQRRGWLTHCMQQRHSRVGRDD